jgi:serine/threonine-protein kinase RsbW
MASRSPRRPARRVESLVERREWSIASDVQAISPIVETVQSLCVSAGFSATHCRLNIPVAITEALANAMLCGNAGVLERHVHVAIMVDAEGLTVDVTDDGNGFDLAATTNTPDDVDWLEREDGRGLFLMRSLMDRVESRRLEHQRGHTIRLVLRRA